MKNIHKDWKFDASECRIEPGRIEISPRVQELMDNGLDVRHYLSRHLQGDCGFTDSEEHDYYTEEVDIHKFSQAIGSLDSAVSEYDIALDRRLSILTYADQPLTVIEVADKEPENLEELYIKTMTLLNQLPPDDRQKFVTSANLKIPQAG